MRSIGKEGEGPGTFTDPIAVAFWGGGDNIIVSDYERQDCKMLPPVT